MNTESRVVVVTGSSSGIGQSIARAFAERGDSIVVHGFQNLTGLASSAKLVSEAGVNVRAIAADVSNIDAARQLVNAAFAWQGRVDVWINAAGADVLTGAASKLSFDEKLDRLWKTDVLGSIRISRQVASRMLEQTRTTRIVSVPTIINLSWDQAEAGFEGDSGQFFSPTKAAIAAFSKSLAKSVGPTIRVNCIAPGWIQTAWGSSASEAWERRAQGESMLGRWGQPSDIANVALMLASRECEFINGQTIAVNGGWKPLNSQ
jgi:3-oxoacyl-[acyl-carrier protein] reductase